MESNVLLIVLGMSLVTYIPRMLPLVLLNTEKIPPIIQGVLKNVPYAILGTLIFPGIFTINESLWYGLIGAAAAFLVAFLGANLVVVVMSSIIVLTVYSLIV
jgi:branched-subunit amino acid transport protein